MSRMLLVVGTVLLVAGVAMLAYTDPVTGYSLGFGSSTPSSVFSESFTRSFSFTGGTFTGGGFSGNFTVGPGGGSGAGGAGLSGVTVVRDTTTLAVETLAAIGLIGVGLVLQVMTIFLWQERKSKPAPAAPASE